MSVITNKILILAGAIQVASAAQLYESHASAAAVTGAPGDLASIEIGELLSTECKPLTIYTEECHVITVPVTTSDIVMETSVGIPSDIVTSSIEVENTVSSDILEPTEEVTAGAVCNNILLQGVYALVTVVAFLI